MNNLGKLHQKDLLLEYFTVAYKILEAVLAIIFGHRAGSIALVVLDLTASWNHFQEESSSGGCQRNLGLLPAFRRTVHGTGIKPVVRLLAG